MIFQLKRKYLLSRQDLEWILEHIVTSRPIPIRTIINYVLCKCRSYSNHLCCENQLAYPCQLKCFAFKNDHIYENCNWHLKHFNSIGDWLFAHTCASYYLSVRHQMLSFLSGLHDCIAQHWTGFFQVNNRSVCLYRSVPFINNRIRSLSRSVPSVVSRWAKRTGLGTV